MCLPDKATRNGGMEGAKVGGGMDEESAIIDYCAKANIKHYSLE